MIDIEQLKKKYFDFDGKSETYTIECAQLEAYNAELLALSSSEVDADSDDCLRISKSGCSLKVGWQDKRIVASVPHGLVGNCNEQWLEDAQRLCDGWNRANPINTELQQSHERLEKALNRIARGVSKPMPDPEAHSWQAFGQAAMAMATEYKFIAINALSPAIPEPLRSER